MIRTGLGYDSHRFADGHNIWLGGVEIPHDKAFSAHSDGDVVLHALTDAILGAIAAGDIGEHFPPTEERWKGKSSDFFVKHAVSLANDKNFRIVNIDITIIAEQPKLRPFKITIANRIAEIVDISPDCVSVKAKTNEKMGSLGRSEGIATIANVLLIDKSLNLSKQ